MIIYRCIPFIPTPRTTWNQSNTEAFMERLWAYKRINYLLDTPALYDPTKPSCEDGIDETLEENKHPSYDEYSGFVLMFVISLNNELQLKLHIRRFQEYFIHIHILIGSTTLQFLQF